MWILRHDGFNKRSICRSRTDGWISGLKGELTVNSPAQRKPKRPTQQAAHSITWSELLRSKAFWRSLINSIVIGRRDPCTHLMPRGSPCNRRKLPHGSGRRNWSCFPIYKWGQASEALELQTRKRVSCRFALTVNRMGSEGKRVTHSQKRKITK